MKEYKIWAFARSAAPNLPALEEQLAEVMREAGRRGYIIVNSCMERKVRHRILATRLIRYADSRAAGSRQRRHGAEP